MDEVLHQAARQRDDGLLGEDRIEEITQAVIDRRRHDGDERLLDAAERLVEPADEFGGKARGKGRPRLVEERADFLEAEVAHAQR